MSISSEISRVAGNIAAAYTKVRGKGGTIPAAQNSDNLPAAIESIPISGAIAEAVTFSANGTYTAPTGRAYSPVTVAIPVYDGSVM